MATITLIEPYRSMWGKLIHGSDWHEQRNTPGGCVSPRGLFVRREMAKMKAQGDLAADPSKFLQDWSSAHAVPMCDGYN